MKRPYLTIIRGLPGMGKSTRARKYAEDSGAFLVEPDSLATCHGEYCYDKEQWPEVLKRAKLIITEAARLGADVIYADVLPKIQDVMDIIVCYKAFCPVPYGPIVNVIEMGPIDAVLSFQRNKHSVKQKDIEKMALEWEPWDTYTEEEDT